MKILLIFPTVFEAQAFFKKAKKRALLGKTASIVVSGIEFVGIVSGIGCKASQDRVREIKDEQIFDLAILCGFCGATTKELAEGDFVFETQNFELAKILEDMGLMPCKIACVKEVANAQKKADLRRANFGAVDMEADFFKPLFKEENFVHMRAVSDGVNSKIPAEFFTSLMDFESGSSSFSIVKFFKLILKKPSLPFILVEFAILANRAKKIYDVKLFEIVKKISDFYLQNKNKNKIL